MKFLNILILGVLMPWSVMAETIPQITVTGEGEVAEKPNIATLSLGVTHQDKRADQALKLTSRDTGQVLDRLSEMGVAPADMQTSQLSLHPVWGRRVSTSSNENEITGFQASNMISVKIRDLDKLGTILDQVASSGANNFQGLSFGFAEPRPLLDQASQLAVKDAIRKAQLLADAAGVKLGAIQSISEAGGNAPQPFPMARMEASSAVPIAQGEVTLSARITVVFAIEQ